MALHEHARTAAAELSHVADEKIVKAGGAIHDGIKPPITGTLEPGFR